MNTIANTTAESDRMRLVPRRRVGNAFDYRMPTFMSRVLSIVIAAVSGCATTPHEKEVWMPPPRVHWSQIGVTAEGTPQDGFQIVSSGPTRGLFPAAIGVTRVVVRGPLVDGGEPQKAVGAEGETLLARDPRNEFLRWNSSFDNLLAVSEVFPIDQRNLGGAPAEPKAILAIISAFHARLGLVYAFNELSETQAEMFGVLYDAKMVQPLALLHAQAASNLPPEEQKSKTTDLWTADARALVRDQFERHLRSCVRELVLHDQPAEVVPPEGWAPAPPVRPVEWPPPPTAPRDGA